jgi:hypothetical protein
VNTREALRVANKSWARRGSIAKKLRIVEEFTIATLLLYRKEINCNQSILFIVEEFAIALPILNHLAIGYTINSRIDHRLKTPLTEFWSWLFLE